MPLRCSCNSVKPKSQQRFLSGDKFGPIFRDAFLAVLSVLNTVISSRATGISVWCHSRNWLFVFSVKSYPWPPIFFLKKIYPRKQFIQWSKQRLNFVSIINSQLGKKIHEDMIPGGMQVECVEGKVMEWGWYPGLFLLSFVNLWAAEVQVTQKMFVKWMWKKSCLVGIFLGTVLQCSGVSAGKMAGL